MNLADFLDFVSKHKVERGTVVEVIYMFNNKETTVKLMLNFYSSNDSIVLVNGDSITGSSVVGDKMERGMPLNGEIPIKDIVSIKILKY